MKKNGRLSMTYKFMLPSYKYYAKIQLLIFKVELVKKMNLGFIMVGLVFLISIPSNSSTTIKNKENPWSYCYSDDLRFLQSKKEGRGISVFLYTRCTEQKYKLLINYSDYEESTFCLSQISQRRKL